MDLVANGSRTSGPGLAGSTSRRMLLRRLLIRCPVTGISADTGWELSAVPNLVPTNNLLVDCPECGQDHQWQVDDAFLE